MSEAVESRSNKTLGDYQEDVIRFDLEGFIEHHGVAFLVHHGPLGQLKPLSSKAKTAVSDPGGLSENDPLDPGADYLVFPLHTAMATRGRDGSETISVGRSEANDVVIPDQTVSAIHVFVEVEEGGEMLLQDLNSTNGTLVNGTPASVPVRLKSGDNVQLGSVEFTYLGASEFRNLVTRVLA